MGTLRWLLLQLDSMEWNWPERCTQAKSLTPTFLGFSGTRHIDLQQDNAHTHTAPAHSPSYDLACSENRPESNWIFLAYLAKRVQHHSNLHKNLPRSFIAKLDLSRFPTYWFHIRKLYFSRFLSSICFAFVYIPMWFLNIPWSTTVQASLAFS